MAGELEAGAAAERLERLLERLVVESLDAAALVADEVVVVLDARLHGLEAGKAVSDVDPLEQPEVGELVEAAVDARDPDGTPLVAEAVVDLLRRQAAVLA